MRTETKLNINTAKNIGSVYDEGIKTLFRCIVIIVPIMEMVVPEFQDMIYQKDYRIQ